MCSLYFWRQVDDKKLIEYVIRNFVKGNSSPSLSCYFSLVVVDLWKIHGLLHYPSNMYNEVLNTLKGFPFAYCLSFMLKENRNIRK